MWVWQRWNVCLCVGLSSKKQQKRKWWWWRGIKEWWVCVWRRCSIICPSNFIRCGIHHSLSNLSHTVTSPKIAFFDIIGHQRYGHHYLLSRTSGKLCRRQSNEMFGCLSSRKSSSESEIEPTLLSGSNCLRFRTDDRKADMEGQR